MGISGTVPARKPSASVTNVARVWTTAGVNPVGPPWAEPYTEVGRDTCLERMVIFCVVLFRGAMDNVGATPAAMATPPEVGSLAPRSRPGAMLVVSTAGVRGSAGLSIRAGGVVVIARDVAWC